MSVTLEELIEDTLNRLNLSRTTLAAQLDSGVSPTPPSTNDPTVSSDETITQRLNEAQNDMARGHFPIWGVAVSQTLPAGQQQLDYSTIYDGAGRQMWAAVAVEQTNVALKQSDIEYELFWQGSSFGDTGTATLWNDSGGFIQFDKIAATDTVVTISGYTLPRPLAALSDTVDGIPDDITNLMPWFAAAQIALKNEDTFGALYAPYIQMYNQGMAELDNALQSRSPLTSARFFAAHAAQGKSSKG